MTYDEARGRVVLFGRIQDIVGGRVLRDTWKWNGYTWALQRPSTAPERRSWMGMAYDPARQETVLFGGASLLGVYGDTWTYDGLTWTKESP